MAAVQDIAGTLAVDTHGVDRLRMQAKTDPNSAVKSAAQQFEAQFLSMMLKSMRDATPQDGMFDSEQTRMYTSMMDQQVAQSLAKRGVGLADVMARQLIRAQSAQPADAAAAGAAHSPSGAPAPVPAFAPSGVPVPSASSPAADSAGRPGAAQNFVNGMMPHALEASRATGIPAQFMVGQAALESGWGKREIRAADGSPSHNLFGIKAGRNWKGPVVEAVTTEYVNGVAQKSVERFRAYGSHAESFRDYASLLKNNPRYARVLERGQDPTGFARGLQQAGYATDPLYADKLARILAGPQLRQTTIV